MAYHFRNAEFRLLPPVFRVNNLVRFLNLAQRYNKFLIYANFFAYFLHFYCIFIILERFFAPNDPKIHEKSTDWVVDASVWAFTRERLGCLLVKAGGSYSIKQVAF
jgi:hypothetical protein